LIRQLLTEGMLIGVFGGGLGLLVGQVFLKGFLALNPMSRTRVDDASLNLVVLGFAVLIGIVASLVFGVIPATQASRGALHASLQESGKSAGGFVRKGIREWLVGAEVTLAVILLATAGLMARSFLRLIEVDPGFRAESVLTFEALLPGSRYPDDASQIRFFQQLTDRLGALPGVEASGAISYLPLGGGENMGGFLVEGDSPPEEGNTPVTERRWVTPGYFAALGIPIQQGRVFTPADTMDQLKVCVINATMVKQFFHGDSPIGRRVKAGGAWRTVVGMVADVRSSSLEKKVRPQLYIPNAQWAWGAMTVAVRTKNNPASMVEAARAELRAIDPFLPVANIRTMEQVVSKATSARRFNMALLAFFAGAALLLTALGIYGVVAFFAGQRRREIGIRMALGAQPRNVFKLILREGTRLVIYGTLVGLALSLATARLVAGQLYGVAPTDPLTFASIFALLLATALAACWLPARRAAKVDPMVALRYE
jgi:putative ABC transport system permease protein